MSTLRAVVASKRADRKAALLQEEESRTLVTGEARVAALFENAREVERQVAERERERRL